jgi:hypothetical protein
MAFLNFSELFKNKHYVFFNCKVHGIPFGCFHHYAFSGGSVKRNLLAACQNGAFPLIDTFSAMPIDT